MMATEDFCSCALLYAVLEPRAMASHQKPRMVTIHPGLYWVWGQNTEDNTIMYRHLPSFFPPCLFFPPTLLSSAEQPACTHIGH